MKNKLKSKCCNANVIVDGIGDFRDSDRICTNYFVCSKCGKSCDIKEVQNESKRNS